MTLLLSPSRLKNLAVAALAVGLSLSASARAAEPGQDEVTLKNGGSIRGTIVSSEPGTSVKIIELGQTQPRVIPWSQVSDVEKGKYAPSAPAQPGPAGPGYGAPPPPPPPAAPPPEPKLGEMGVIRLHIDSPVPVTLIEERSGLIGTYGNYGVVLTASRNTCTSPCDIVIDGRRGVFHLDDSQVPSPGPMRFDAMKGDVTMHVDPGSKGQRAGGVLAVVLGATAAITGGVVLPIALGTTTTDLNTEKTVSTPNRPLQNAGIGMLVGGLAALGGGIALFVTGATHVRVEPSAGATTARVSPRYWMGEF